MCLGHEAQLVEHRADNAKVGGSTPPMPIKQVEWNESYRYSEAVEVVRIHPSRFDREVV